MCVKRVFGPPFQITEDVVGEVYVEFDNNGMPHITHVFTWKRNEEEHEHDEVYT